MSLLSNLERYVQNAYDIIDMLEKHPVFVPVMQRFCNVDSDEILIMDHPCGTSYCVAGYQAHIDKYPAKYITTDDNPVFDYFEYSSRKCGYNDESAEWLFIYGQHWPNTRESVIERCNYIIENASIPDMSTWDELGWNDPNDADY